MLWNKQKLKNFQQAHKLYQEDKNKTEISKILGIRRPTIIKWLNQDSHSSIGWIKGKSRKYSDKELITKRICKLKKTRLKNKSYFHGSEYIQMDYAKQYPKDTLPSLWFIQETIRQAGLQTRKPKQKKPGGSEYLLYPVQCIRNLPGVHQSSDFIGKKYITGSSNPINIFSSSYYSPFKLYQIKRITAEKAVYVVEQWQQQWQIYPIPDIERLDNGLQFRGTASGKRALGIVLKFLLNLNVTPVFGAPSKPWTNPHIEGHNRVFNEKVWSSNWFTDTAQLDTECERFNQESQELLQFKYAQLIVNGNFNYLEPSRQIVTDRLKTTKGKKIYFIRFVESFEQKAPGQITIMNEVITLPEKYTHQFVFVEWDLFKEQLSIYSEFKKVITFIKRVRFRLNL